MTCSKCKSVAPVPGQRWCRICFAAYKRTARVEEINRKVKQARLVGAEHMRITVINRFELLAQTEFNGLAVAEIVRMMRVD